MRYTTMVADLLRTRAVYDGIEYADDPCTPPPEGATHLAVVNTGHGLEHWWLGEDGIPELFRYYEEQEQNDEIVVRALMI